MCTNAPEFAAQDSTQYGLKCQIEKLERYLKGLGPVYLKNADKSDFISLTGGEPSLHPDFFRLLAYFRKRLPGISIALLSNGRGFADKDFTRRLLRVAKPPFTAAVAVHGASPRIHDRVAGVKGAFKETIKGLKNLSDGLKRRVGGLEIRIVLHRLNVGELKKILEFLLKRFPAVDRYRVVVMHYEIEGMSFKNHEHLALRLSESAKAINAAGSLINRFPDLRLYHFPLCLVGRELRSRCWITLPPEDRIYPEKCAKCRAGKKCLGLMLEYYRKFGDAELKPL